MIMPIRIVLVSFSALLVFACPDAAKCQAPTRENCERAAAYNRDHDGVSLLVMYDGRIIFEDYTSPYHATSPDSTWQIASGTKGFNGPMAAAMIMDGMLSSFDELACETITEWKGDPLKSRITVRHLLSLSSGLDAPVNNHGFGYADAIAVKALHEPGTAFQYSGIPFQCFGVIVQRKLQARQMGSDPVEDYLRPRILDRIASAPAGWTYTPQGDPFLSHGARYNARNWAPYGELLRLGGIWNGDTIIPPAHLDSCFIAATQASKAYGISWWLESGMTKPVIGDIFCVLGAGGQHLYVSRSRKLVVIRQTSCNGGNCDSASLARVTSYDMSMFLSLLIGTATSVERAETDVAPGRISIFPHPVIDQAVIETNQPSDILITDILGRQMWRGSVHGTARVDLSRLPPGCYQITSRDYRSVFLKR